MQTPVLYTATVLSVDRLAGDYYLGRFRLADPLEMKFAAGQYVIFHLPAPKLRHTMSIASAPSNAGEIEILQHTVAGGAGSAWFTGLQAGETVRFTGPLGKFTLEDTDRQKVFVATGSGIAPFRSMIIEELKGPRTIHDNQMTLYWGLRHETDVFWKDEFESLAKDHLNFRFLLTLSKPTDAWTGAVGRVTDHVTRETLHRAHSEFYLCGRRQMIVDTRALLIENGVPEDRIFTETFF